MEELLQIQQVQIDELKREIQSLKSVSAIPLDVERAFKKRLGYFITGSATIDFGSTASQRSSTQTMIVAGASIGDPVFLSIPAEAIVGNIGGIFIPYVSAADTVSIRFINPDTGSALDPASGVFTASVFKKQ